MLWGGQNVRIADEESWLHALGTVKSDRYKVAGAWKTIIDKKGKEYKFQSKDWLEKLKDKNFKAAVMGVLEDEFVNKYKKDS